MPFSFRGYEFRERRLNSPVEALAQDNSSAVRQFWHTNYATRNEAAAALLGYSQVAIFGTNKYISRLTPIEHPDFPGQLYAERVTRISPYIPTEEEFFIPADNIPVGRFEEAEMTVNFLSPMYRILSDAQMLEEQGRLGLGTAYPDEATLLRYVTPRETPAGKWQTLPSLSPLKWISGGDKKEPVVNQNQVLLPEADVTIVWEQVPVNAFNMRQFIGCCGKTNCFQLGVESALSVFGLQPWPAESLVFGWPDRRMIRRPTGEFSLTVTIKAKFLPNGANSGFRWDKMGFIGYQAMSKDGKPHTSNKVQNIRVQTLAGTAAGAAGGTFRIAFNGQTTDALTWDVTDAAMQTALQALSTVGAGNATVVLSGTANSRDYTLTFAGAFAARLTLPMVVVDGHGLIPNGTAFAYGDNRQFQLCDANFLFAPP